MTDHAQKDQDTGKSKDWLLSDMLGIPTLTESQKPLEPDSTLLTKSQKPLEPDGSLLMGDSHSTRATPGANVGSSPQRRG